MSEPEPQTPDISGPAEPEFYERFMALVAQGVSSPEGSILDKLSPAQLGKVVEHSAEEDRRAHFRAVLAMCLLAGLAVVVPALAIALCWLYLAYGEAEQAEKIVSLLVGFVGGLASGLAGGYGLGRWGKDRE